MRSTKAICGLAVMALVLSGCGGSNSSSSSGSPGSGAGSTGSATVSWTAPTTNSDGTALTDLAGFYIYYGTNAALLTNTINVANAGAVNYVIANLGSGTWYFTIAAYTNAGLVSPQSNVGSKTIT